MWQKVTFSIQYLYKKQIKCALDDAMKVVEILITMSKIIDIDNTIIDIFLI